MSEFGEVEPEAAAGEDSYAFLGPLSKPQVVFGVEWSKLSGILFTEQPVISTVSMSPPQPACYCHSQHAKINIKGMTTNLFRIKSVISAFVIISKNCF